jgi:hypothetical protein
MIGIKQSGPADLKFGLYLLKDAERRQAGRAGKFLPRQVPWLVGKALSLAEQDWAMKFRIFT